MRFALLCSLVFEFIILKGVCPFTQSCDFGGQNPSEECKRFSARGSDGVGRERRSQPLPHGSAVMARTKGAATVICEMKSSVSMATSGRGFSHVVLKRRRAC